MVVRRSNVRTDDGASELDALVTPDTKSSTTLASLNLDHLTKLQHTVQPANASFRKKRARAATASLSDWGGTCARRGMIVCHSKPTTCGCLLVSVIVALFCSLLHLDRLVNPVQHYGTLGTPDRFDYYTNIQSVYDLTMGEIDHWCLGGGDSYCTQCQDPLIPTHRGEYKSWLQAWKANRQMLQARHGRDPLDLTSKLDVVFLGESIVEELDGRWMGRPDRSAGLAALADVFGRHFGTNATVQGLALGIAGDTASNVLWRVLHGEMPEYLHPKVWWLSLGNNDLARTECSEEVVVIGILRVVEEILQRRPRAKIVINSMFPMTATRGGFYPLISDFEDSFSQVGNRRRLVDDAAAPPPTHGRGMPLDRQLRKKHAPIGTGPASPELSEDVIDTDMSSDAEEEEKRRDKHGKRQKQTKKRDHNPVMTDRERVRTYELRESPKPLWTSIRVINKALREFATKNKDSVYFYDATDIFTEKHGKSYTLLTDRITIRGHPTELGFRLWEDAMVTRLEEILATMRKDQPDLFVVPPVRTGYAAAAPERNKVGDDDEYSHALRSPYDESSESTESSVLDGGDTDADDNAGDDSTEGGDLVVKENENAHGDDEANPDTDDSS